MSVRTYAKEEKQAYIEDYKNSGEPLARYALESKRLNKRRIETSGNIHYNLDKT